MMSARRAREADFDKVLILWVEGSIYRLIAAHSRTEWVRQQAVLIISEVDAVFPEHRCNAGAFRGTGYPPLDGQNDDRTAYLEHAEWPQNICRAGGNGTALQCVPGEHHEGGANGSLVPSDQPEQQDPGHCRSRRAGRQTRNGVRVRRHPALSWREDGKVFARTIDGSHPGL